MDQQLPFTHLSDTDKSLLARLVSKLPPGSRCLEVGSYLGASAIITARNLPAGATLTCVDTWRNDGMSEGVRDTFREFVDNTKPYADRIAALRMTSAEAAQDFAGEIDFLFIDGDHSYEGCKADFEAWVPKLRDGGVVVFHDVLWAEGVQRVIRDLFLPMQGGVGGMEGNIYYGYLRRPSRPTGVGRTGALSVTVAVISSHSLPPGSVLEAVDLTAARDCKLLWVEAGMENQRGRHVVEGDGQSPVQTRKAREVGLLAGRHLVLEESDSDVIIFLDDDVALPTGWLAKMLLPFADPEVHIVGCRYLPDYEQAPPAWMETLWTEHDGFRMLGYLSLLDGGDVGRFYDPCFVWGLCFAVRRETALKLGGFHPDGYPWKLRRYRGDGETGLSMKARLLGLKAFYQGGTHVLHKVPASRMTPQYLERRAFLQGVSDSFARVRRDGQPPPTPPKHWKDWLRPIKTSIARRCTLRAPTSESMRILLHRAHAAGARWYECEVRRDPRLLGWALQPNFFGCMLPPMQNSGDACMRNHGIKH